MSNPPDLAAMLRGLAPDQTEWLARLAAILSSPTEQYRLPTSDVLPDDRAARMFGDTLKVHHGLFAAEPFRRERFEYALERVTSAAGRQVVPNTSRTRQGYDMRVDGERWSLKTQANSAIKPNVLWVSKWMELGQGEWTNRDRDLVGLRDAFLRHMDDYDRIFMLRCLTPNSRTSLQYELLEIPKELMLRCTEGTLEMMHSSRQMPKPGRCYVRDGIGACYELYFDGGTERKLQVTNLRKDLCVTHATWRFNITPLD